MEGTLCQTTFQKLALTVVLAFWQTHTGRTAGRTAFHRTVKCPGSFGTSVFHPLISHKAHFNVIQFTVVSRGLLPPPLVYCGGRGQSEGPAGSCNMFLTF